MDRLRAHFHHAGAVLRYSRVASSKRLGNVDLPHRALSTLRLRVDNALGRAKTVLPFADYDLRRRKITPADAIASDKQTPAMMAPVGSGCEFSDDVLGAAPGGPGC